LDKGRATSAQRCSTAPTRSRSRPICCRRRTQGF